MTIRTRLLAILLLVLLGVGVTAGVSLSIMSLVRIGSPAHRQIIDSHDLTADVLPPSAFIIESYLSVYEMVNAAIGGGKAPVADIQRRCQELEERFEARLRHWQQAATIPPEIKARLEREVAPPAREFFRLRREELMPALAKEDFERVNKLVFEDMLQLYTRHRQAIAGVVELAARSSDLAEAAAARQVRLGMWMQVGLATGLILCLAWLVRRIALGISGPLRRTIEVLAAMSSGDTSRRLEVRGTDEISQLSAAVNRTVDNMAEVVTSVTRQAGMLADEGLRISAASRSMVDGLQASVQAASRCATGVEGASGRMDGAAASTHELRQATQGINAAIHELSSIVATTSEQTQEAQRTMLALNGSAQEIGSIVKLISRIADQTSTLALNATIQGAAAGEAGRGFLVVANEVKELARRTHEATIQVAGYIDHLRSDTTAAVGAIASINATVDSLTAFQQTVLSTVTQQSATTDAIDQVVHDVASTARAVLGDIRAVHQASEENTVTAQTVGDAAAAIGVIARDLREMRPDGQSSASPAGAAPAVSARP